NSFAGDALTEKLGFEREFTIPRYRVLSQTQVAQRDIARLFDSHVDNERRDIVRLFELLPERGEFLLGPGSGGSVRKDIDFLMGLYATLGEIQTILDDLWE